MLALAMLPSGGLMLGELTPSFLDISAVLCVAWKSRKKSLGVEGLCACI